jgi:hypothetical protein
VPKERGEKIAIDHGIRFVETSAKANINIDKAFFELAEAVLDKVSNSTFFILQVNQYLLTLDAREEFTNRPAQSQAIAP